MTAAIDPRRSGAVLKIHDEFRVIALANRPGYPFLGNDFFAEMGDVFACHQIQNPDQVGPRLQFGTAAAATR